MYQHHTWSTGSKRGARRGHSSFLSPLLPCSLRFRLDTPSSEDNLNKPLVKEAVQPSRAGTNALCAAMGSPAMLQGLQSYAGWNKRGRLGRLPPGELEGPEEDLGRKMEFSFIGRADTAAVVKMLAL